MKKLLRYIFVCLILTLFINLSSCVPPKKNDQNIPIDKKPNEYGTPPIEELPDENTQPPIEELPPTDDPDNDNNSDNEDDTPIIEPLPQPDKETPPDVKTLPITEKAKIEFLDEVISIARGEPKIAEDKKGQTKYGEFFGYAKSKWDTEFILWCVNEAETKLKTSYIGSIYTWKQQAFECVLWYISRDKFKDPATDVVLYAPQKGDLLFFDYNLNGSADHTALVTDTTTEEDIPYILTIEGQIPGDKPDTRIRERKIKTSNKYIYGYGSVY